MTTPFGMPTFVKVGKKKTPKQLGAPGNPRPPTESGPPSAPDNFLYAGPYSTADPNPQTIVLPSASVGDRVFIQLIGFSTAQVSSAPDGFTLVDSTGTDYLYYRDFTSTAPSSVEFSLSGSGNFHSHSWTVRNAGGTTLEKAAAPFVNANGNTYNPPAVPVSEAGTYLVITVAASRLNDGTNPDGSAGYTESAIVLTANENSFIHHAFKDLTTSEDPASYVYNGQFATGISIFTVAMTNPATVAKPDHTHVEADVTDLDHTDSNAIHDNVASEISVLSLVTAASGDHVLIEDASDSNNKKRVAASDFLGAGGGGVDLIENGSVGTGTSFTITAIPTGYEYLRLFIAARTDRASVHNEGLWVRVGDGSIDSANNYAYGMLYQGTSSGVLHSGADTKIRSNAAATGGLSAAVELGHAEYTILNYDDVAEHTQFIFQTGATNSGVRYLVNGNGSYLVANVVDQLQVVTEGGSNFTRGEYWLVGVL